MIFSGLEVHGTVNNKLNFLIITSVTRCVHLGFSLWGLFMFSYISNQYYYFLLGLFIYFIIWDVIRIIFQNITIQKIRGSSLTKNVGLIQFEIIAWTLLLIWYPIDSAASRPMNTDDIGPVLTVYIYSCLIILVFSGFEINGILKKNLFIMTLACIIRCIHFGGILFLAIYCDFCLPFIYSCVSVLIWDLLRIICQAINIHHLRGLKNASNDGDLETSACFEELTNE